MIIKFCKDALRELEEYKHTDKEQLMLIHISERLDASFNVYSDTLEKSITYLLQKDEQKVMRRMNRTL